MDAYATDQHVYIVEAVGGDESNSQIQCFLTSFTLGAQGINMQSASGGKSSESKPTASSSSPVGEGAMAEKGGGQVFSSKEVERRVILVSRPEPGYTEEARKKNVTGVVKLKAIFTSSGKVSNIEVTEGLPRGLTERAVAAARSIKFIPAIKNGYFVSQYAQLEYHFNIY